MKLETTVHPMAEAFVDEPIFNAPLGVRDVLRHLEDHPAKLTDHLRQAFRNNGFEIQKSTCCKVIFYQVGQSSWVFVVEAFDEGRPVSRVILQVARGPKDSPQGEVVTRDFYNLQQIAKIDPVLPPRVCGGLTSLALPTVTSPAFSTEYLNGYHEINRADNMFDIPGNFFAQRPSSENRKFDFSESIEIMQRIIGIISSVFAKTYDVGTKKGLLLHDVDIDAGDFVYRSYPHDTDPFLKLITARKLTLAAPQELLFYIFSDTHVVSGISAFVGKAFRVPGDEHYVEHSVQALRQALKKVFLEHADEVLKDWVGMYQHHVREDVSAALHGIQDGTIASFDDVPAGYKSMLETQSVAAYLSDRAERTRILDMRVGPDIGEQTFAFLQRDKGLHRHIQAQVSESMIRIASEMITDTVRSKR